MTPPIIHTALVAMATILQESKHGCFHCKFEQPKLPYYR